MATKNEENKDGLGLEIVPAKAKFDVDMVVAQAEVDTKKYLDLVITEDGLASAKKDCTELNKMKTLYDRTRIDGIKLATAPLTPIEEGLKKCAKLYEDTRSTLLERIDVFEEEYRKASLVALNAYHDQVKAQHDLHDDYDTVKVEDLLKKAGNLTKTGNLTKPSKDEIERRVLECLTIQTETERRKTELESYCINRGLSVGMSNHSIQHILFAPTTEYYEQLNLLIDGELERQQKIQEEADRKAKEKADADAQKIVDDANKAIELEKAQNDEKAQKIASEDGREAEIGDQPIVGEGEKLDLQPKDEAEGIASNLGDNVMHEEAKPASISMKVTTTTTVSVPMMLRERYPDDSVFKKVVGDMVKQMLYKAGVNNISNVICDFD